MTSLCVVCQKEEEPTNNPFIGSLCINKFMTLEPEQLKQAIGKLKNPIALQMASKFFLGKHIDIKDITFEPEEETPIVQHKKKAEPKRKLRRSVPNIEQRPPSTNQPQPIRRSLKRV